MAERTVLSFLTNAISAIAATATATAAAAPAAGQVWVEVAAVPGTTAAAGSYCMAEWTVFSCLINAAVAAAAAVAQVWLELEWRPELGQQRLQKLLHGRMDGVQLPYQCRSGGTTSVSGTYKSWSLQLPWIAGSPRIVLQHCIS